MFNVVILICDNYGLFTITFLSKSIREPHTKYEYLFLHFVFCILVTDRVLGGYIDPYWLIDRKTIKVCNQDSLEKCAIHTPTLSSPVH